MATFVNNKFFQGAIENEFTLRLIDSFISLVLIFIGTRLLILLIERVLKSSKIKGKMFSTSLQIIKNTINVLYLLTFVFTVLDLLGVNTASLLATAGIGGVAIGFGAQSLVKDVITGFFILLEGQYYIGDEVVINSISGDVIDFSLRTTQLRDFNTGAIHFIPNGTISIVENRSRIDQLANVYIDVPSSYSPDMIISILKERLKNVSDERIVDGPEVRGITNFKDRYYTIFIFAKVKNGNIYAVQREIRKIIADEFVDKNIKLYQPLSTYEGEI